MNKWYKNTYRRHLLDMHINDTKDIYMSKFNIDEYLSNLKTANIDCAMIYIQSHTGLCNFISKAAKTHKFFLKNPHMIKDLMLKCKKEGIKVVGYYSLIFNNYIVKKYPNMAMRDANNKTFHELDERYELACPNSDEYRKFIIDQLKEIKKENYPMDGIFFDMPYYEIVCACPNCQKRFYNETHKKFPKKFDFNNETFKFLLKKRQEWMGDFTHFVKEETNKLLPNVTVEFNYAAAVSGLWVHGSTEAINEESEFTGGDLYGDYYAHSFAAKYYYQVTKNQPFEYMTCRCNPSLREHSINKPFNYLEGEIMLSSFHHGASLIIDAINPDGTMDKKVYQNIGKVFKESKKIENTLNKGKLYSDVAIFFDSSAHYSIDHMPFNFEGCLGAQKTLIENHIQYSVIANRHLNELNKYQMIVASSLNDFYNDEILKFIDYVKNGGTLYISGRSDPRLMKEFFDAATLLDTNGDSPYKHQCRPFEEIQCYVSPRDEYKKIMNEFDDKYPLPVNYRLPLIKHNKGEVKGIIVLPYTDPDNTNDYASIHGNPPGLVTKYPAIIETRYYKGKVIYSSCVIEKDNRQNFKDIFLKIVKKEIKQKYLINSSRYVESIVFEDKNDIYLNLFDLDYINEINDRKALITLPKGKYEINDLFNKNKFIIDDKFETTFKKYQFYKIKKL